MAFLLLFSQSPFDLIIEVVFKSINIVKIIKKLYQYYNEIFKFLSILVSMLKSFKNALRVLDGQQVTNKIYIKN